MPAQCLGHQQSLLLQLKNSLVFDSASSTKLVHWNQSVDCCSWEGVTCNEGRIIGLDLTNESISGGLDHSSNLFCLQYLRYLSLASNNFSSEIPSQFDKLTNLSYLNLSNACFTGQIPIAILHLTRLVTLDLSTNDFKCKFRYSLKLESPNLKMMVQNLSELMELHLDRVNISAQGYEWGTALSSSLPKLRVLSLSSCDLSGPLDSSLTNLQSLSIIHLDGNDFDGPIPKSFADFKNLTSLVLSSSRLNGTFPEKIFQIPTLETLDLSYNFDLQGSLPEFPLNGSLRMLVLHDTNFSGTLPNSIGNLKMLSKIDLSFCNFNGSIPKSMASLAQLLYLDMSSNYFVGSIPSFNMGKNLTTIKLSNNNLSGQITSTRWEELLNLEVLDLRTNSLEGSIPMSLFSLPSLQELTLSNNRFFGQLNELLMEVKTYPYFLINQSTLSSIDLSNNKIHGEIPNWIWKLPYLDSLNLSYNHLETLDFSLLNMSSLSSLDLHSNQLQGQLSVFPEHAQHLDFSGNNFSSVIPANIGNFLTDTYFFSLSSNKFNGSIPSYGQDPYDRKSVRRFGPDIYYQDVITVTMKGVEAKLVKILTIFTSLDFSCNNFDGHIPEEKIAEGEHTRIKDSEHIKIKDRGISD
ncbi:hypothetical protein FH972_017122 [Carpinus fangiana]|uniref:Uncharacterized protein n=1 Tax=Carpinus fangiana TaxID=176857 RepID=A0A5N6RKX6_9ROSI|nr:hypothetical protein FH972_017122 [Carpinus fangiana]